LALVAWGPDFHILMDVGVLEQRPGQFVGGAFGVAEDRAADRKITRPESEIRRRAYLYTCSKKGQLRLIEQLMGETTSFWCPGGVSRNWGCEWKNLRREEANKLAATP